MKIIESALLVDTIDHGPFRPHRKKRIAKKWLKKYGRDIEIRPKKEFYILADKTIVCHPEMAKELRLQQNVSVGV